MTRFATTIIILALSVGFVGCQDVIVTGPEPATEGAEDSVTTDSSGSGENQIDELSQQIEDLKNAQAATEPPAAEETPPMEGGVLTPPHQQKLPTTDEIPLSVDIDATPPEVRSTWPADSESGVHLTPEIQVRFDERIDPRSLIDPSNLHARLKIFQWTGSGMVGDYVPIDTFRVIQDLRQVYFKVGATLLPKTTYKVILVRGIKDTAGNAMRSDYGWSFQTR